MGLLGDGWDDPKSMATLQLAAGLLSPGSFGQGLGRGLAGYQGAMANSQDMQVKAQQMEAAKQQLAMQQLKFAQDTRMFNLQTPFLEEAVRRMHEASGLGAGQQMTAGASAPSFMPGSGQSSPVQNQQSMTTANMPAPQQPHASMFPGVPDSVALGTIGTGGFAKLPELIGKYNEPTEMQKMMLAAGIDPASAEGIAVLRENIAKSNYIAPVNARPGAILRDPKTMQAMAFNPHVPEGGVPVFDASGNVTAINPLMGATSVMQAAAAAKAGGTAQFTPYAGYQASGAPSPVTSVASALGGGQQSPILQNTKDPVAFRKALEGIKDPQERQVMLNAFDQSAPGANTSGGLYATPPLGATTAADAQQADMSKRYSALRDTAAQAQTTTSYLQNIKQLAATASTGQFSDKAKFVNALLDTAGLSDRATDAVTANNLLDKYGNQIVARLGQGGLSTDSARAILQSAYPNAHMTVQAIHEAADNLIGANELTKAKMIMLSGAGNAKDPVKYQQLEQAFDQNADPRLWQIKAMSADEAHKYLFKLPTSVRADLAQQAKVLKDMGAL